MNQAIDLGSLEDESSVLLSFFGGINQIEKLV